MPKDKIKVDDHGSELSLGWDKDRGEVQMVTKVRLPEPMVVATGAGGRYGPANNGIRVGVFWEGIEIKDDTARFINPRVVIDRDVNIQATVVEASVSGNAVLAAEVEGLNLSGVGEKKVFHLEPVPVPFTDRGFAYLGIGARLRKIAWLGDDELVVETTEAVPRGASFVESFKEAFAYFMLDRREVNGLIRSLRRARDQVFGPDE